MATKREREDQAGEASLSFEQALAQLEEVVRSLEDGQTGLDESLAKYEQGVRLLKVCRESLVQAERKILLLTGVDAEGNPQVEPFSDEALSLEEKRDSRVRRRSRDAGGSGASRSPVQASNLEEVDPDSDSQRGLF